MFSHMFTKRLFRHLMKIKNPLIKGTLILTIAGFLSRILGFYNRIFLSRFIGAKEVGIYQLIFPVYLLCFSICCQGIETSISRMIASCPPNRPKLRHKVLLTGISFSFSLSLVAYGILYFFATPISSSILNEPACAICLKIISFALPFVSIKACILGYELGMTNSLLPASTQLIEQLIRVGSIYALSVTLFSNQKAHADVAVFGMAVGEIGSFFFLVALFLYRERKERCFDEPTPLPYKKLAKELLHDSVPLTSNRLVLTLLQSAEAVLIPSAFLTFYQDKDISLEVYGILTGMVMPFIFFPSAITNSLSVMLLPTISSAKARKQKDLICKASSKSIYYSILIGIFSCFLFLFYGKELGYFIFHSRSAGELLFMMALICPFTYLTTTLSSILNGLGKTSKTFLHNMIASGVILFFVIYAIPRYGITGYLWGLLASDLILIALHLIVILTETRLSFEPYVALLKPACIACISGGISYLILPNINNLYQLFFKCGIYGCSVVLGVALFAHKDFTN